MLLISFIVALFCVFRACEALQKPSVLIVQNKGGGHGTIGYQLCKSIAKSKPDLDVHLIQDKCNYKSAPFSSYSELKSAGVNVLDSSLSDADAAAKLASDLSGLKFDYVIDNWSKTADNAKYVIDLAKKAGSKQYVFVSSAGMYKSGYEAPLTEKDPVKTNDARKIELEVSNSGLSYTFLRPQYIYGPKSSKRYLDYFIGRAYRKLPIPVPLHGEQLVCLTHIEDVADLITTTIGHPAAMNQIFNCGTDRYITYKGIGKLVHTELGNSEDDQKYIYYNPDNFPHWDGKGVQEFPFRKETFITTPSKIKQLLGWSPKKNLADEISVDIAEYKALGGFDEKWTDEEIKYDLEVGNLHPDIRK